MILVAAHAMLSHPDVLRHPLVDPLEAIEGVPAKVAVLDPDGPKLLVLDVDHVPKVPIISDVVAIDQFATLLSWGRGQRGA